MGFNNHDSSSKQSRVSIYSADSMSVVVSGYIPSPQPVPYGTNVKGVYFDGYPQIVKAEASAPKYKVKVKKNVMVPMRDGVRVAIDIYYPDAEGEKFPAILCWGEWGKDCQDIVEWMDDKPQLYLDSPFWDGSMEGCNYKYTVPRGYVHIIAEPRGIGNSEGVNLGDATLHDRKDIYDTVDWIAKQPWCDGNVVMMGPSSYSRAQLQAAQEPHPHLVAIRPDEAPEPFAGEDFHGIWDPLLYNIHIGKHAYDHLPPTSYKPQSLAQPNAFSMFSKEELERRLQELLDDPDIKYNMKFYAEVKYPASAPMVVDQLLYLKHPVPLDAGLQNIKVPMYIGAAWNNRLYEWGTFEAYMKASLPNNKKKLILYPPMFPARPYTWYHDEAIRWFDYWVKGIDNGIMDEPPIKLFVMGINKWKFESEWPIARTKWTKFYLHPQGGLSTKPVEGNCEPESFTQPAPYLDPKVYCLRYITEPFSEDTEVTGNLALHLDAAIDIDDTNWMVDVIDVDPQGKRRLISSGYLKAKFRALDEKKSTPYRPVHLRQEPVPVVPGEKTRYDIALLPTSNVFLKGHSMELVIRNQDDMLSTMARNGVYMLPFMRTVTHTIYFGESHLLVPIIPKITG
ncbi:CocE/NonD family hydrolase [Moorella sulfitireducens]|uniref:CocE/NonD family hydrolase n=1 Tax=Neomoorella sulfitireducens TaxID=2972948 RepID=UPI0021AC37BF|nr:CocE/NonD family hydrolase [Moorella sulfitireducens]